jgi:hypothetical protein
MIATVGFDVFGGHLVRVVAVLVESDAHDVTILHYNGSVALTLTGGLSYGASHPKEVYVLLL